LVKPARSSPIRQPWLAKEISAELAMAAAVVPRRARCQKTTWGSRRQSIYFNPATIPVLRSAGAQRPPIDSLHVRNTQSARPGGRYVMRLAVVQILGGILIEFAAIFGQALRITRPDARRAFRQALGLDFFEFNRVHRHRIGADHQDSRGKNELR